METDSLRRIAASHITLPDGTQLHNHVVELWEGRVVNYYPLEGELPMTEWLGGSIIITADGQPETARESAHAQPDTAT